MDVDEGGWRPLLPGFFASHQGSEERKKDNRVNKIKRMLSSVEKQMFLPNIINATDPKISILLTSVLPIVNLKSREYNK